VVLFSAHRVDGFDGSCATRDAHSRQGQGANVTALRYDHAGACATSLIFTCGSNRCTSSSRQSSVPGDMTAAQLAATATRNAFSNDWPDASAATKPPRKLSPAPTVLTALIARGCERKILSPVTSKAPCSPSVSETIFARPARVRLRHAAMRILS